MAFECDICGKGTLHGSKGIHKHSIQWKKRAPSTSKGWKPNLRNVKIEVNGEIRKMRVCARCLKSTKIISTEPLNLAKDEGQPAEVGKTA